ncbi:hypothetical protein HanPSC8_Chr01g0003561 [Helianthus annuus]|nr:hypothetical protein HanPSC8_Chr01g0003561 [Helianthus annuus]
MFKVGKLDIWILVFPKNIFFLNSDIRIRTRNFGYPKILSISYYFFSKKNDIFLKRKRISYL